MGPLVRGGLCKGEEGGPLWRVQGLKKRGSTESSGPQHSRCLEVEERTLSEGGGVPEVMAVGAVEAPLLEGELPLEREKFDGQAM